jgi:hypothetical protein
MFISVKNFNGIIKHLTEYRISDGKGFTVDEKDKNAFLQDFKDANIEKKLDMWYYAIDQEALWEEILDMMSKIARIKQLQEMKATGKKITAVSEDE